MAATPDCCHWLATFADGSSITQYQDGQEHSLHHIRRDQVVAVTLLFAGEPRLTMQLAGEPWFYRKRTQVSSSGKTRSLHLLGKQKHIDGKPTWLLMGLFADTGELLQSRGFQPGWLYAPEFLPHELQGSEPCTPTLLTS